jgi:ferrochelatase
VAAIVLSPQHSPILMGGYGRAVDDALPLFGQAAPRVELAGSWHDEPAFVDAVAGRLADALARLPPEERAAVRVLMTAHSLPRRVAEQEPDYLGQLRATAEAVASRANLAVGDWTFCWQSAGHEPGEWMTPDFAELMPEIAASGGRAVVVVPVQFLADHLETLYDIDVGAHDQASAHGLRFHRTESLNAGEGLARALAAVARGTLDQGRY